MNYINRSIEGDLTRALQRGKSILLLGPRQTGKTTLLNRFPTDLTISLVKPAVRQRYERDLALLEKEIELLRPPKNALPTICLDEVQKIPPFMDVVQDLVDRKIAQFILTGSSARKLRRGPSVNLLPGRVVAMHLDPLSLVEAPATPLEDRLLYGELPEIVQTPSAEDRDADLRSYVTTYLEEEIRAEAIVRNLASFSRFLELAASESGKPVNFSKLSQEIGGAHTTIMSYYEILEDCLIVERVEPWTQSKTRKKLTKAHKYLFFDCGVRRVAAMEPTVLSTSRMGNVFEEWVGLQLIRLTRNESAPTKLHFWRDPDGPEVDWVIHQAERLIPIEVKWSEAPSTSDAKHLRVFLDEYPNAKQGYVVCRTPRPFRLLPNIDAIPWQHLPLLVND